MSTPNHIPGTFSRAVSLAILLAPAACAEHGLEPEGAPIESYDDGGGILEDKAVLATFQAESRTATSGCTQAANYAGYTGAGFMDFGDNGTWIEWNNVNVATAGQYKLNFRYANARANPRPAALYVNGANVGTVAFNPTGAWTTWGAVEIPATLSAGNNTIRVMANTSVGGPNLDGMQVLSTVIPCADTLPVDGIMRAGDTICSPNRANKFGLASDGNPTLWSGTSVAWQAGYHVATAYLAMQGDGNLVLYSGNTPLWASNTSGHPGASLSVLDDRRVVVRYQGTVLWSEGGDVCPSGTCGSVTLDRIAGTELRVASYNVMRSSVFPLDNGGTGSYADRIDGFKRIANAIDADVWAMQEVMYDGNDQPGRTPAGVKRYLEKITGGTWYMAHQTSYQEFVFSRYPIDASGSVGHRVVWTLIDVGNDNDRRNDVVVISVHFVTNGGGADVDSLVRSILAGTHPQIPRDVTILVAGDFNNGPNGPRYAAVRSAMGVPDVRPIWLGTPDTRFTHGSLTYTNGAFNIPGGGTPIDYVFARSNGFYAVSKNFILSTLALSQSVLDAHGLRRMDTALHPAQPLAEGVSVACDHFPLIVDLRSTL